MALGELLTVGAQDHGDVGEGGHRRAHGLVDHDLARGVGEVVVTANDVGDAHQCVVHHGGEVVGGGTVGAEDDEVVELLGVEGDLTMDGVVDHDVAAVLGHLDAQNVGLTGIDAGLGLLRREVAATALVALERVLAGLGGLAVGGQLLGRAEAGIGLTLCEQALGGLLVKIQSLGLGVGAKIAADLGALVPVEAKPAHGAQDDLGVLVGGAGRVGVVDAQDEGAAVGTGEGPVVDGGAGAADVQLAGGRGRKADADGIAHTHAPCDLVGSI